MRIIELNYRVVVVNFNNEEIGNFCNDSAADAQVHKDEADYRVGVSKLLEFLHILNCQVSKDVQEYDINDVE
jgi:hypothetical protein